MIQLQARTVALTGTSYDIGKALGTVAAGNPMLQTLHTSGLPGFEEQDAKNAAALLARWVPGLEEELAGFAETLGAPAHKVLFYGMTCLRPRPRCSQIALSGSVTAHGRPLLARSYEFNHEMEDFCLVKTSPAGKYTHMGTSVLGFGREDGFNQHGLAIAMSSCGFPVGANDFMRPPALDGLQYWAVVRALLENCRNVDEALDYLEEMPIAYNLNMGLVDKSGAIALVETMDGARAVYRLPAGQDYLHVTNHGVLRDIIKREPKALRHSLLRYDWVKAQMDGKQDVTAEDLKAMLLSPFPQGLCCDAYQDFFGTTKSMVMDPACGTIELCWGGRAQNGWRRYDIGQPLPGEVTDIEISPGRFDPSMGDYLPLDENGGL